MEFLFLVYVAGTRLSRRQCGYYTTNRRRPVERTIGRFRVRDEERLGIISGEEMDMNIRTDRNGFTIWEAIGCVVVLVILVMAFIPAITPNIDAARAMQLKTNGRGIWFAIASANADREAAGLPPVWPQEMGFTVTNTSTVYFRRLMSDSSGKPIEDIKARLVSELAPDKLAGAGLPYAKTAAAFTATNNAWCVTCVSSSTPPNTTFLFSRNLDVDTVLSSTSRPVFVASKLTLNNRAFWVTCAGSCFDAREKWLTNADLLVPTNCPPVAVMRP